MKLLIVEDNQRIAQHIKRIFSAEHLVDLAASGNEGEHKALTGEYTVIILDLGLPEKDGLNICKTVRRLGVKTPILILTAQSRLQLKVTLLEGGADDYLIKPFSADELRARVTALSRRGEQPYRETDIYVADMHINTATREVYREGKSIRLRRKEFDILEYLVRNRGRTVTRDMILRNAWEADRDNWHNTVDVHVKYLRDKIDKPFATPLIKTEYGIGYKIEDSA